MNDHAAIGAVLDAFHEAAAIADEAGYFSTLTDDVVFLGTAPGERWEGAAWREFVHSFFDRGHGWAYAPSARSLVVSPDGSVAWFDETVENDSYGTCRGSGVLRRENDEWRIAQYNLTLPIPDELVPELRAKIAEMRPA